MTLKSQCVWKFPVPIFIGTTIKIEMPIGARILCVQREGSAPDPFLFALASAPEDSSGHVLRTFSIYATGTVWHDQDLEQDGIRSESTFKTYVGSFEVEIGPGMPQSPIWQSRDVDWHAQNGGRITCHLFEEKPALR